MAESTLLPDALQALRAVYSRVKKSHEICNHTIEHSNTRVHCIPKTGKTFTENLRSQILGKSGTSMSGSRIIQVIGDSGSPFSEQGVARATKALQDLWTDMTFVEYGYTTSSTDANRIVSNILEDRADLGARSIGYIVDASFSALDKGCTGSNWVKNFVLYYASDLQEPGTRFGDDIFLSDGIMEAGAGDKMLCLEGGIQSLHQAVNALLKDVPVIALPNLRELDTGLFSAASFLLELQHLPLEELKAKYEVYRQWLAVEVELERLLEKFGHDQLRASTKICKILQPAVSQP